MAVDLAQVIPPLVRAKVDFILIGGMAGILHGSARVTFDVDLVYLRTPENIERLAGALATQAPKLRDAPANLPFQWDAKTIQSGLNFTLTTNIGDLDLFGEIAGGERVALRRELLQREAVEARDALVRGPGHSPTISGTLKRPTTPMPARTQKIARQPTLSTSHA